MNKNFILRKFKNTDFQILLDWRNDEATRKNSFNPDVVSINQHKLFIDSFLKNQNKELYILEFNKIAVGTIREERLNENEYELSYTVDPVHRGKKIGQIMMSIYLFNKVGSFFCLVKKENIASIKMLEQLNFKLVKTEKKVNIYTLEK